jgi:hypothetical protein
MKLQDLFEKYSDGNGGGDKGSVHSYIDVYAAEMVRKNNVDLLEIGVWEGHSLAMWGEYFDGNIVGVDVDLSRCRFPVDARLCDATNENAIQATLGDQMFDYIIDDGSHRPADQVRSFELLWPRVKQGGKYFVEDIDNDDALAAVADAMMAAGASFTVYDLRAKKNRWDDVLVVACRDS